MMSWERLLKARLIEQHKTSQKELDELRELVGRNLQDAQVDGLSLDLQFAIAYNACLLLAKMVLACAGYRTRGHGAHKATFEALKLALGDGSAVLADYLSDCRRKRNRLTYNAIGVVSESEAKALIKEALEFKMHVEEWIKTEHPEFGI